MKICIIDDDESVRTSLATYFRVIDGAECIEAGSLDDLKPYQPDIRKIDVSIIDINLGVNQPDGLEIFQWMSLNGFQGRTIFISGHAVAHPQVKAVQKLSNTFFVAKPMELDVLESLLKKAA